MGYNPTEDALIAGIDIESAHRRRIRADREERLRKRQRRSEEGAKDGGGEPEGRRLFERSCPLIVRRRARLLGFAHGEADVGFWCWWSRCSVSTSSPTSTAHPRAKGGTNPLPACQTDRVRIASSA